MSGTIAIVRGIGFHVVVEAWVLGYNRGYVQDLKHGVHGGCA